VTGGLVGAVAGLAGGLLRGEGRFLVAVQAGDLDVGAVEGKVGRPVVKGDALPRVDHVALLAGRVTHLVLVGHALAVAFGAAAIGEPGPLVLLVTGLAVQGLVGTAKGVVGQVMVEFLDPPTKLRMTAAAGLWVELSVVWVVLLVTGHAVFRGEIDVSRLRALPVTPHTVHVLVLAKKGVIGLVVVKTRKGKGGDLHRVAVVTGARLELLKVGVLVTVCAGAKGQGCGRGLAVAPTAGGVPVLPLQGVVRLVVMKAGDSPVFHDIVTALAGP